MDGIVVSDGAPTPDEYAAMRADARWNAVDADAVARGLPASLASVVVRDDEGSLVAMGRIVGDGGVYLYLQDVIVRSDHRDLGIGTAVTEALLDRVRVLGAAGTFVGLMAAAGVAPFYERFGFQRRGDDRPGMWLSL
jgi:GNAT superfamily N-acetyltransferase